MAQLQQSIGNSQEAIEAHKQEIAVAEFRIDALSQLKDWTNPFDVPPDGFNDWIKCYRISDCSIIDKNGRTFWYYKSQCKSIS